MEPKSTVRNCVAWISPVLTSNNAFGIYFISYHMFFKEIICSLWARNVILLLLMCTLKPWLNSSYIMPLTVSFPDQYDTIILLVTTQHTFTYLLPPKCSNILRIWRKFGRFDEASCQHHLTHLIQLSEQQPSGSKGRNGGELFFLTLETISTRIGKHNYNETISKKTLKHKNFINRIW